MNLLKKYFFDKRLPLILSRRCRYDGGIPRSGERAKQVNCFIVYVYDDQSRPYLMLREMVGDEVDALKWKNNAFSEEYTTSISEIIDLELKTIHYIGTSTVEFSGPYAYIIKRAFPLTYVNNLLKKIWNLSYYYIQSKRKITSINRISILKALVDYHIETKRDSFSLTEILDVAYTYRWALRSDSERYVKTLNLYLDSLVDSGDVVRSGTGFSLTGRAINTIDAYETDEDRHKSNFKLSRLLVVATLVIALATFIQACTD